jgi:hypothetical protein
MSAKVLRGADKKKDAETILEARPLLVLFFMDGCPHCEANQEAWEEAKQKAGNVTVAEIEASAVPESTGITGFPTMQYFSKDGKVRTIQGAKQSGDEIKKELQLGGRVRRNTLRRRNRLSRKRRLHRTLRNYVPLV